MIISAFAFGALLFEFTAGKLIQVIQGSAVVTIILNVAALWKQEARDPRRTAIQQKTPRFSESWAGFIRAPHALRRLIAIGLGTAAFSMQDVLLEPYGGQVLGMTVGATTMLTAALALGSLFGFGLASRVLSRGADPFRMASHGALVGVPGFLAIIVSAPALAPAIFTFGVLLVGFGGGLFAHGTLTATMVEAPEEQTGLALGAWGAVQATAAGLAMAAGGVIRDVAAAWTGPGPAGAYAVVYGLEVALLLGTVIAMLPLVRDPRPPG
jgi:BCD family chlorophyll transporter-like MFS transporter